MAQVVIDDLTRRHGCFDLRAVDKLRGLLVELHGVDAEKTRAYLVAIAALILETKVPRGRAEARAAWKGFLEQHGAPVPLPQRRSAKTKH